MDFFVLAEGQQRLTVSLGPFFCYVWAAGVSYLRDRVVSILHHPVSTLLIFTRGKTESIRLELKGMPEDE
jgi:hypothetical protein